MQNELGSIWTYFFACSLGLFFYLLGLCYLPHFEFQKSKKKRKKKYKMIGKVGETIQNDCTACCLHKHLDKTEIKSIRMVIIV